MCWTHLDIIQDFVATGIKDRLRQGYQRLSAKKCYRLILFFRCRSFEALSDFTHVRSTFAQPFGRRLSDRILLASRPPGSIYHLSVYLDDRRICGTVALCGKG